MIRDAHCKPSSLPPEDHRRIYRGLFQGAWIRAGASLIMWLFALVAYTIDVIGPRHFFGVSLAVL